jgi:polar amino acid transport system substrate-binding protein
MHPLTTLSLLIRAALLLLLGSLPLAVSAQEVVMAFGEKIPPFCFPESDSGIELEVIGEALAFKGHKLVPRYYPLARVPLEFKMKHVDAAMTDLGAGAQGGHFGDPAVLYDNVFVTLTQRALKISKPEDLDGLVVVSFPGALKRYPQWLTAVDQAHHYFEQNNQELQVTGLNKGRFDVVLSDKNIFHYFELQLTRNSLFRAKAVDMQAFTTADPNDYRPVFRSKQIRDDFNLGLAHLKATGRYQTIYDSYLK